MQGSGGGAGAGAGGICGYSPSSRCPQLIRIWTIPYNTVPTTNHQPLTTNYQPPTHAMCQHQMSFMRPRQGPILHTHTLPKPLNPGPNPPHCLPAYTDLPGCLTAARLPSKGIRMNRTLLALYGLKWNPFSPYRVHRIITDVDAAGWRPTKNELDRYGRTIPDDALVTNFPVHSEPAIRENP